MLKRKKILKLYTHHELYVELSQKQPLRRMFSIFWRACSSFGGLILGISSSLAAIVFYFFYYLGVVVIYMALGGLWLVRIPMHLTRRPSISGISQPKKIGRGFATSYLRQKLQLILLPQFKFALSIFLVLAALSTSILQFGTIVTKAIEIKQRVLGVADLGLRNLNEAQELLNSQELGLAGLKFGEALQSFDHSQQTLGETGAVLGSLLNVVPQKRDGQAVLAAASAISNAGIELTKFYEITKGIKISPEGLITQGDTANAIAELDAHLKAALGAIEQADALLATVSASSIPRDKQATFLGASSKLSNVHAALGSFVELFSLFSKVVLGNKKVLLLFENNNELRASGGFVGTYGDMLIQNGKIKNLRISSIYDLDGQLTENINPPYPLLAVNNKWYLRDSNWFANFPDSAKKMMSFYEKEGGETPDMVIAMTPSLIVDLLQITGPITMPRYNITLSSDNFVEATQVATSVNYDRSPNKPKQLLADFFPALLQRLANETDAGLLHILETWQINMASKQILLYSRDSGLEHDLESLNWAGVIRPTDRDYLSIVSSNLGGTKTDLYLHQEVKLETAINKNGEIQNTLSLTRSNPLSSKPGMENKSFVRFFVPEGSTLIGNLGFSSVDLSLNRPPDFKNDADTVAWESSTVKDVLTGMVIGKEAGKTFFGNWLEVAGGEKKTVSITYTLPFRLQGLDHYSLLLQKQAGTQNSVFTHTISFSSRSIVWKNMESENMTDTSITLDNKIEKDYFYGLVFEAK